MALIFRISTLIPKVIIDVKIIYTVNFCKNLNFSNIVNDKFVK